MSDTFSETVVTETVDVAPATSDDPGTVASQAAFDSETDAFITSMSEQNAADQTSAADEYLKKYEVDGVEVEVKAEAPEATKSENTSKELTPEQAGFERLQAREDQVRKAEQEFEVKVAEAVKAKLPDFKGKSHDDILKHYGIDPEIAFKQMMYERASDSNPVKARLKEELREYHNEKWKADTKAELEAKDRELTEAREKASRDEANRVFLQDYTDKARAYVTEKVDEKATPTVHKASKAKADWVHARLMREVRRDALEKLASGVQADVLTYEEAAKNLEAEWAELASIMTATNKQAPVAQQKKTPTVSKPIVKPMAALSTDEEVDRAIDLIVARQQAGRR